MFQHGGPDAILPEALRRAAETVGFPVDDVKTSSEAEYEVDEPVQESAGNEPVQGAPCRPAEFFPDIRFQYRAELIDAEAFAEPVMEFHFADPVRARDFRKRETLSVRICKR